MKSRKLFKYIGRTIFFLSAWVWLAGCKDNEKADYIHVSTTSYTFDAVASQTLDLEVNASRSWSVEIVGDWILQNETENNRLVIGATPTRSNSVREGKLIFRAGNASETVELSQLGTNLQFSYMETNIVQGVMSPTGNYLGGVNVEIIDNVYYYTPFVVNVATGYKYAKPSRRSEDIIVGWVSDQGVLYVIHNESYTTQVYDGDSWSEMPVPAGYSKAVVQGTSVDGTIEVGYVTHDTNKMLYPVKWVNREPILLDMPTETPVGSAIKNGVAVRGCSHDGSILYGSEWDSQTVVIWNPDGSWYYACQDKIRVHTIVVNHGGSDMQITVADRPMMWASLNRMSPSGKYLAIQFNEITVENKAEKGNFYAGVFDLETGVTTIVDWPAGVGSADGMNVTDQGVLSFSTPYPGMITGYIYDLATGTTWSANDYILKEYGYNLTSPGNVILKIVNDGQTVLGSTTIRQGNTYHYWYLNSFD